MLPTEQATCPYCWESLEIGIEPEETDGFWEDCHVCCRPIYFIMQSGQLEARSDDD